MGGQGGAGAAIGPAPGHRRLRLPRSVDIGIATIVAAFLTGGFGFAAIVVDHLTASPPPPANRGVVAEPSTPAKPRVTVTVRVPVPGVTITVTPTIEPVASPTGAAERSGSPPPTAVQSQQWSWTELAPSCSASAQQWRGSRHCWSI